MDNLASIALPNVDTRGDQDQRKPKGKGNPRITVEPLIQLYSIFIRLIHTSLQLIDVQVSLVAPESDVIYLHSILSDHRDHLAKTYMNERHVCQHCARHFHVMLIELLLANDAPSF